MYYVLLVTIYWLYSATINEEYKLWRKNVPFNYDLLLTHALSWPSLSVQWFPTCTRENSCTTQNLLLSTHTSGKDQEFITIAAVTIPDEITDLALDQNNSGNTFSKSNTMYGESKIKVVQEIPIDDEVNRARYSPFAPNIIATRTDQADVHVYDTTRHSFRSRAAVKPDLVLTGHRSGGYGLSWNTNLNGILLTSGEDGLCCVFDVNHGTGSKMACTGTWASHDSVVGDAAFSFYNANMFVSVGDDRRIVWHDLRKKEDAQLRMDAHTSDIYCVSYSPVEEHMLATGSKEGIVRVWDERKIGEPLYSLTNNAGEEVLQVQWSPHVGSVLASSGNDRRVTVWDLARVGAELTNGEKEDGPAEVRFVHGGHTNAVCDFSWNPLEPYEIASVAEDNIIQIWQMTSGELPLLSE